MVEPRVVESESGGFGYCGSDGSKERRMIQGGADDRRESSIGEKSVEREVHEDTVEARQSGYPPVVQPSEHSIKVRELEKRQRVNSVIKRGSKRGIEVVIIFLIGSTDEIEVAGD